MNQEIIDKVNAALDQCDRRAESIRDAVITAVVQHCAEIANCAAETGTGFADCDDDLFARGYKEGAAAIERNILALLK